jgi:hypothetical protein
MNTAYLNPVAGRRTLILMAGIMWICVGVMLVTLAAGWLCALPLRTGIAFFSAGILLAMPIHHFGFLRIVTKNLKRLLPVTGKKSIFYFMSWKSYLIIPVMITMGYCIRHSGIPKQYVAVIYTGIGMALFLSGIRYIRFFLLIVLEKETGMLV